MRSVTLAWSCAVLVAACLDDEQGGGGAGGGGGSLAGGGPLDLPADLPQAQLCDALVAALLSSLVHCGEVDEADAAELSTYVGEQCQSELMASIAAGAIAYDGVKAATCLEGIARACVPDGVPDELRETCEGAMAGQLKEGDACYDSDECGGGSCDRSGEGDALACPGQCLDDAAPGRACGARDCVDGHYCNAAQVCAAAVGDGGACDPNEDPCDDGLVCISEAWDKPGVCAARRSEGGACFDSHHCARGLACDDAGKCAARPGRAAAGQPCHPETPRSCLSGLFCLTAPGSSEEGAQGTCSELAPVGGACKVGGGDLQWFFAGCEDDAVCSVAEGAEAGVCTLTTAGGPCASARVDAGEDQTFTVRTCSGSQTCDDGACVAGGDRGDEPCRRTP